MGTLGLDPARQRRHTMTIDPQELGAALDMARDGMSFKKVERALWTKLGAYAPSDETLRRYHRGQFNAERVDIILVSALCDIYKVKLKDIAPDLLSVSKGFSDLLKANYAYMKETRAA